MNRDIIKQLEFQAYICFYYETLIADFDVFLMNKHFFLIMLVYSPSLGCKVNIALPDRKITIFPNLCYKIRYALKTASLLAYNQDSPLHFLIRVCQPVTDDPF